MFPKTFNIWNNINITTCVMFTIQNVRRKNQHLELFNWYYLHIMLFFGHPIIEFKGCHIIYKRKYDKTFISMIPHREY